MKRLRSKLSYANVMVTILAFVVLAGGTAYAAVSSIKPNSVGASALKPNSVGSEAMQADSVGAAELQPEAVGIQQLQNESIVASKIKNGSVTPSKLSTQLKSEIEAAKGETGAAGPQGTTGAQGVPGRPGEPGTSFETEVVNQATATDLTTLKEMTVHCPSGPVLGGGYVLHSGTAAGSAKLRAIRSYPVDPETWLVRAVDDSNGTEGAWELTVSAVCEK